MRRHKARFRGVERRTVARVVTALDLGSEWREELSWLVKVHSQTDLLVLQRLRSAGLKELYALAEAGHPDSNAPPPCVVALPDVLEAGDVVALSPERDEVQILYRPNDLHHTVFLTNRCNSRCVMCSQPPTHRDDSWLVEEARRIAAHIGNSPDAIGFTGGEPLLLESDLRNVLETFGFFLPATQFEVLTNGRLLSDHQFALELLQDLPCRTSWMVPLYGHADFLHDNVVQAAGAFDQTIAGLLNLHEYGQSVQLRIVLIEPVLQVLVELCSFIAKNLPFVGEVALMGCEPTGLALANRSICEVDIRHWGDTLGRAIKRLERSGLPALLMNVPLCAIPSELWPLAKRSISDWKQTYAAECAGCEVQESCCGLFAWHERGWRPAALRPIRMTRASA